MINFKCKIQVKDITYGPKELNMDDIIAWTVAGELTEMGYRKTSNAFCKIARVDREDWLEVMAKERRCCVADFYNMDGTGVSNRHRDAYIRSYSEDGHTVSPAVLRRMQSW